MKSRTNANQELMRQQIIEEERNNQFQKFQNQTSFKLSKSSPRNAGLMPNPDRTIGSNKSLNNRDLSSKPFITLTKAPLDCLINKRQRSSSYSLILDHCQTKRESFSPVTQPMDMSFSNLGNDESLDWSQIEPSITTTSEISQDILDQIAQSQHDTIVESYMETGTEENDSLPDDQSVSSMKPSTSCPANMAHPTLFSSGQTVAHHKASQKLVTNAAVVTGIVEDQKIQWMRDRNKKDCHNRIERKRRDYINNQIQELGELLPEKLFLSTESKRNKGGILKNSVIYIQQLQQVLTCLGHLREETHVSENVISAFYKRLQYMENILAENGVNYDCTGKEKSSLEEWFNIHQHNSHLLHNIDTIQSSWSSSDQDNNDKLSAFVTSYEDVTVKSEDFSAENVLNSALFGRMHSSNSGAGCSSSGSQSVANYSSPLNTSSMTNTPSQNNNNIIIRSLTTPTSNVNIISANSPQPRHAQVYCSSQPFSKTGIKLYEPSSSKSSCIIDSPVLSSILIGSSVNASSVTRLGSQEYSSATRPPLITGLSNSVPDGSRTGYLTHSITTDNSSTERYYLIPISKTKGIQLMASDLKNSRGIIKVDTNLVDNDDPVLSRIHSEASVSPRITVHNSYSTNHDDEVQNFIEISPDRNDDSLMDEFEFDDIVME